MGTKKFHVLLVAVSLFILTSSVNAEMPLFSLYVKNAGFGIGMITLAFASYILGVLFTTLFFLEVSINA